MKEQINKSEFQREKTEKTNRNKPKISMPTFYSDFKFENVEGNSGYQLHLELDEIC